ncbi:TIGR03667 family PPOX class F420-dependent oxidoreductase [Nocardia otitidiscaviarum]|uniref:TIGR03667 family PPOX class F420-dependent oxidoreductase n=1 Tax=Nocardia otitidiscaviarum TaxID=1823 RepID=A0A516NSG8_9NOCA|nr:TIGR03667 family PPOX class F420-dependent oxidoreductase [Nocardia otitidiscaviarum]MCP9621074.1 TIGR03667 family PPOX class F420-dependent oxidoreductase [Nocardia otitidiscaviarum]QDP81831.1 TIGR03667 family PPOX class F420-dependent oxidoreductase [Nocardia otitidiscaviarum]
MTTTDALSSHEPVVDPGTEFGKHVTERFRKDTVAWLTTVGSSGTPQPNPVWFLWDGTEFLIFSQPDQAKLRNIARNPRVSLHLNSTETGGDVVILTGDARIDPEGATPPEIVQYTRKYTGGLVDIGMTDEQFYSSYSVVVRVRPDRLRGF